MGKLLEKQTIKNPLCEVSRLRTGYRKVTISVGWLFAKTILKNQFISSLAPMVVAALVEERNKTITDSGNQICKKKLPICSK